ncbi:porphobilinogen synthase [Notoacmeibacter ruber]|nr:porphobilinogen synthase [Notoacmeibacter ruber]
MRRTVDEITGSHRLRRMRKTDWSRRLVAETRLTVDDLIWPCFVTEGEDYAEPIDAMPGISRLSIDRLVAQAKRLAALGVPAIAPFPHISGDRKDERGSHILDDDNLMNRLISALKADVPEIGIISDVALDPFTSHGHDGVLRDGIIVNDETVEILAEAAVGQARAGSDIIAPSDMMDGRIGAIRDALDAAGYQDVAIMSYSAKYASGFYGPYRDAIGTRGLLKGDKQTYYLSPTSTEEALREVEQDLAEGADMVMVKPGLPYLDICQRVKETFKIPTFAYQVSGEFSMIEAASAAGMLDHDRVMMESLMAFRRAGVDGILSYFTPRVAELLAEH